MPQESSDEENDPQTEERSEVSLLMPLLQVGDNCLYYRPTTKLEMKIYYT